MFGRIYQWNHVSLEFSLWKDLLIAFTSNRKEEGNITIDTTNTATIGREYYGQFMSTN